MVENINYSLTVVFNLLIFNLYFHRRGLDVPYYFICPYSIKEDEDYVYFHVTSSTQYLYAFKKSDGELLYRTFPTLYDSTHQHEVTYLRSIVDNKNFF